MTRSLTVLTLLLAATAARADGPLTYERDVRPIFRLHCFHCHAEGEKPKGKLDLRTVKLMAKGGHGGPAVVPGKPAESVLWEQLESDAMPEGDKKLTAAQKETVRRWIEQGAKTLRPEPDDPNLARFTPEELNHWAFQPVKKPAVPAGAANPVDAFLLAKLREKGFGFSPAADKRTLIRRASFDLTGLPPTPEEVDAFLQDESPGAWAKLVDRLLASPHYGERWGRHWLDVAGYAETEGNPGKDTPREHAWRYRDYVIRSLNADKPYDQFVREQIAGDELVSGPADPQRLDKLAATGFLRMAPDPTQTSELVADRNAAAADVLKVVGSAVTGLTVGCAQCHDHKYDPVTSEDYYRLRAVFDPAFNLKQWVAPADRVVDLTPADVAGARDLVEFSAAFWEKLVDRWMHAAMDALAARFLAEVPAAERAAAKAAAETPEEKRTSAQKALLEKYPKVKSPKIVGTIFLDEFDKPTFRRYESWKERAAWVRGAKPLPTVLMTVKETPPPESRVMHRGDPDSPRQAVRPGELAVLARHRPTADFSVAPAGGSSGRRRAYAAWLTGGDHPLTARVAVNRAWMHHFGRGIVHTPGEFGVNGDRPTHPELLDWLAADFAENGWSLKRLHRQLMLTDAYRQRSARAPDLDRADPENKLLGRMPVRRLDAESVRDALLAVTGELNRAVGGPSVPVTEDYSGKGVVGVRELSIFGKPYGPMVAVPKGEAARRSVYLQVNRSIPLSMLDTFDAPAMAPNCDRRKCSTVPPQSLLLLNDQSVVERADALTERVFHGPGGPEDRVRRAYALLYAAEPSARELADCLGYLKSQTEHFRTHGDENWLENVKRWPHAPDMRATAALCQALLAANRFLYVD